MAYITKGGNKEAGKVNLNNNSDKSIYEVLDMFNDLKGLEVGCGKGRWLKIFPNIDGFEINKDYVEKAQEELGKRIWIGDIDKPKTLTDKYDFVFSTGLIEHFDDSLKIIRNHLRFLKENGICIIIVPASGLDGWLNVQTIKSKGNIDWREYGRRISNDELDALMNGAGLENVRIFRIGSILRGSPKSTTKPLLFVLHSLGYIIQRFRLRNLERKYGHMLVGIGVLSE